MLFLKNILNNSISLPIKMWHILFTIIGNWRENISFSFLFVLTPQNILGFLI